MLLLLASTLLLKLVIELLIALSANSKASISEELALACPSTASNLSSIVSSPTRNVSSTVSNLSSKSVASLFRFLISVLC